MRVLIRCDATPEGGVGHLARSAAIAEAARETGWDVVFSGIYTAPLAAGLLPRGMRREPRADSSEAVAALAASVGADLVHVDDYAAPPDLRERLASAGLRLSSIEDGEWGRRPADLVLMPSPAAFVAPRPDDGSRRVAGGAPWVPLRPGIRDRALGAAGGCGPGDRPDPGVVVALGGTDAFDATSAVLGLLDAASWTGRVTLLGPDRPPVGRDERVRALGPVADPAPLFAAARLVISGAGTTTWELSALRAAAALVLLTENQRANYDAALAAGGMVGLGELADVRRRAPAAVRALRAALEDPPRPSEPLVDGRGAERIVGAWSGLVGDAPPLGIRPAEEGDVGLLFAWRDDPVVRAASRSSAPLVWAEHRDWFARTLRDPNRLLVIARDARHPLGAVRLDRSGPGSRSWEVSVMLAARARGRGLSRPILELALAELLRSRDAEEIVAVVREDNAASLALFSRSGFGPTASGEPGDGLVRLARRT